MGPDDKICYCYGVSLRKLESFARRRRPVRASQMSECLGAGTGCGWCIPVLRRIFERAGAEDAAVEVALTPEQYAEQREAYLHSDKPKNTF